MSLWQRRELPALAVDSNGFALNAEGQLTGGTLAQLADALAVLKPGTAIDVVAASDAAVHWLQPVPQSLASLAELRQATAARCAHLFGGKPLDWWIAADWRVDRVFVCAALMREYVSTVEAALATRGLHPRWTTVPALMSRSSGEGWSCIRSISTLVLWHKSGQAIDSLATLRVHAAQDAGSLRACASAHAALEGARHGFADTADVQWIDIARGASEAECALSCDRESASVIFESETTLRALAFGRGGRLAPIATCAALLAATGAAAVFAVQAREGAASAAAAEIELSQLRARDSMTPVRAKENAATQPRGTTLEPVARQLNTPWSHLLDALEGSLPDEVALVSIERDASNGKLRLQAEAKTLDTLIAYAARLREVPLFAAVTFLKHETNEQDANRPTRLVLEAELASPRVRAGEAK